jgi:hypothetical protein
MDFVPFQTMPEFQLSLAMRLSAQVLTFCGMSQVNIQLENIQAMQYLSFVEMQSTINPKMQ